MFIYPFRLNSNAIFFTTKIEFVQGSGVHFALNTTVVSQKSNKATNQCAGFCAGSGKGGYLVVLSKYSVKKPVFGGS
jgi:hypothetical protein